jgi:hypothetical protein
MLELHKHRLSICDMLAKLGIYTVQYELVAEWS